MSKPFEVIKGGKHQARFVCTWCAASFQTHAGLERHWNGSPLCKRNKGVSNQTQSKYNVVEDPPDNS